MRTWPRWSGRRRRPDVVRGTSGCAPRKRPYAPSYRVFPKNPHGRTPVICRIPARTAIRPRCVRSMSACRPPGRSSARTARPCRTATDTVPARPRRCRLPSNGSTGPSACRMRIHAPRCWRTWRNRRRTGANHRSIRDSGSPCRAWNGRGRDVRTRIRNSRKAGNTRPSRCICVRIR